MRFESKARNLQNLIGKLKSAKILPLIIINKDDINKTSTINKIIAQGWENMKIALLHLMQVNFLVFKT